MKRNIKLFIYKIEHFLFNIVFSDGYFFIAKGYCPCCDREVIFRSKSPWLRDFYLCTNCFSKPRERALMLMIEKYYPNWRELTIFESSPIKRGTSVRLKKECLNYIESQYYPSEEFGKNVKGTLNQNIESLTLNDSSIDIFITQDVFEHLYNAPKAFSEINRVLKYGGSHIFTVPIINKHFPTEVWAIKDQNGKNKFLYYPEVHGNPADPNGSPVTMHWGYDIIDVISENTGMKTIIESVYDISKGISAEFNEVFITKKE